MAFGFEEFKLSQRGQTIAATLNDPSIVAAMISMSQDGEPPVKVVGKNLTEQNMYLSDEEKRHVGRWVREVMEMHDWTTDGGADEINSPGAQFKEGAIYYRKK